MEHPRWLAHHADESLIELVFRHKKSGPVSPLLFIGYLYNLRKGKRLHPACEDLRV